MSQLWKQAITSFITDKNQKTLRSKLRKDWIDFYPDEKLEIFRFLFLSKQYKLFFYFFAIDLQNQISDLPWTEFLTLYYDQKGEVPAEILVELNRNFKRLKLLSMEHPSLHPLISEIKKSNKSNFVQNLMKHKQELIASARIAESEGLVEQHFDYMNQLKKISPSEYNVSSLVSEQQKKRAERIVQKLSNTLRSSSTTKLDHFFEQEEKSFLKQVKNMANEFLKSKSAKASDFAFLLRSMGDFQSAIEFLELSKDESIKQWQLLDYLLSGKQYVALLSLCRDLKKQNSNDPDSLFAISYAESIAYWELGEKRKAIALMEQISTMRPDYKSATETLNRWKDEAFE